MSNLEKKLSILTKHKVINKAELEFNIEAEYLSVNDPNECHEVWSAYFKGHFRKGNKKYCDPLMIADSFSKHIFSAKGMLSPNTKNTKAEFIRIFRRYGLTKQIHTDNGQPFSHIRSLGLLQHPNSYKILDNILVLR